MKPQPLDQLDVRYLPPVFKDVYYYGPFSGLDKPPVYHIRETGRAVVQYLSCIQLNGSWLGNSEENPLPHELLMCKAHEGKVGRVIASGYDSDSFNIPNVYHYTSVERPDTQFREGEGKKRIRLGQDGGFPFVLSTVKTYNRTGHHVDLSSQRAYIAAIDPKRVEDIQITPYDSQDTKYHSMQTSGKNWSGILSRAYLRDPYGCTKCFAPDLSGLPHMVRTTRYGDSITNYSLSSGIQRVEEAEDIGLGYVLALFSEIIEWS